jgi:hypothetical protein
MFAPLALSFEQRMDPKNPFQPVISVFVVTVYC